MYALIDCNNFYASCERVFNPKLINKPVVVLSNKDGCVIARSNEAKAIGIPMGAPAFKYRSTFDLHNVAVFSANFALYGDMSRRIMNVINSFCDEMEIYSIDEAFLDLSSYSRYDLNKYAQDIKEAVYAKTGIPVSIGIAPTKALAKAANKVAKKFPQRTNGVHAIDTEERRIKALKWTKIEDVWGIGWQHTKKLQSISIFNAYEFCSLDENWVRKYMSIIGLRLQKELKGESVLQLDDIKPKKAIASTRSFEKPYFELNELKERIATFSISCAEKLRRQNSKCQSLMIFVHTNYFNKQLPQYSKNIVVHLPYASNSSIVISQYAIEGLSKIFKKGYAYKKAGVILMNFSPDNVEQIHLFDNPNPKHKLLMSAMDKVNTLLGVKKLKLASQDLQRQSKMKQERLSPRYTTNWNELLKINE